MHPGYKPVLRMQSADVTISSLRSVCREACTRSDALRSGSVQVPISQASKKSHEAPLPVLSENKPVLRMQSADVKMSSPRSVCREACTRSPALRSGAALELQCQVGCFAPLIRPPPPVPPHEQRGSEAPNREPMATHIAPEGCLHRPRGFCPPHLWVRRYELNATPVLTFPGSVHRS